MLLSSPPSVASHGLCVQCAGQREETLDLLDELPPRALVAGIKGKLASLCLSHLQGSTGSTTILSPSVAERGSSAAGTLLGSPIQLQDRGVPGYATMGRAVAVLEHVQKSLSESQYVLQAGILVTHRC